METFIHLLSTQALYAHWIFFFLLILAGFNLPISEDLIVLSSAVIAATVVPQNTYKLFVFVFLGCYLSDWIAYWIGRSLTPWLKRRRWLAKLVDNKRIFKVNEFYAKYGVSTLLFGRFIPFGIRNFLFMSAGMVRMHFGKFILVDGIACLLSNTIWFTLAYSFAENYPKIFAFMRRANIILFSAFIIFIISAICYKLYKRKKSSENTPP